MSAKDLQVEGERLSSQKDWAGAAASYRASLEIEGGDGWVWFELANALCKTDSAENITAGLQAYSRCLQLLPSHTHALLRRGSERFKRNEFRAAAEDFGRSIKADEDSQGKSPSFKHLFLGKALLAISTTGPSPRTVEDVQRAVQACSKALELDEHDSDKAEWLAKASTQLEQAIRAENIQNSPDGTLTHPREMDLVALFESLGISPDYALALAEEGVEVRDLGDLTDDDLARYVKKLGPRRRLQAYLRNNPPRS